MYGKYSAVHVAAAFLLIRDSAWKYDTITRWVLDSGLSGLGRNFGKTPSQTMKSILLTDRLFQRSVFRGYYELWDRNAAIAEWQIRSVVEALVRKWCDDYRELLSQVITERIDLNATENRRIKNRLESIQTDLASAARVYTSSDQALAVA